jgi:hypothetical protein
MAWLAVVGTVFSYVLLPFTVLSRWLLVALLVALAPALHLGRFILSAMLFPLRLLAKLEVQYLTRRTLNEASLTSTRPSTSTLESQHWLALSQALYCIYPQPSSYHFST